MPMLKIKDKPGCISVDTMRLYFERMVRDTPAFAQNTPLDAISINGQFSHFVDPETDTMWLGFALGMRCHERVASGAQQGGERKENGL